MLQHLLLGLERPEYICNSKEKKKYKSRLNHALFQNCRLHLHLLHSYWQKMQIVRDLNSSWDISILKIQEVISFEELCGSIMTSIFFNPLNQVTRPLYDSTIRCYHVGVGQQQKLCTKSFKPFFGNQETFLPVSWTFFVPSKNSIRI